MVVLLSWRKMAPDVERLRRSDDRDHGNMADGRTIQVATNGGHTGAMSYLANLLDVVWLELCVHNDRR